MPLVVQSTVGLDLGGIVRIQEAVNGLWRIQQYIDSIQFTCHQDDVLGHWWEPVPSHHILISLDLRRGDWAEGFYFF